MASSLPVGTPLVEYQLPPELEALGLAAIPTTGDGNCLFHALSDQVYGHQGMHAYLREEVIKEIRANAEKYKPFMPMGQDAGPRRNLRRRAAPTFQSGRVPTAPTAEELDANFEAHLDSMAQNGTYGGHIELVAFASHFQVDIKVLRAKGSNLITCEGKPTATYTIVYHDYEHYSSVRFQERDPKSTEVPEIGTTALTAEELESQSQRITDAVTASPISTKTSSKKTSSKEEEEIDGIKLLGVHLGDADIELDSENDTDVEDWSQGIPERSPSAKKSVGISLGSSETPSSSSASASSSTSSSTSLIRVPAQGLPMGQPVRLKLPFNNGQQEQVFVHLKVRVDSAPKAGSSDSLEEQMVQVRKQLARIEHLLLQGKARAASPSGSSSKLPPSTPTKRLGRAKGIKKAAAAAKAKAKGGKGKGVRAGRASPEPAPP